MEPEADRLIAEGMHFNLADEDEYPHTIQIQERCVNILARLFHAHDDEAAVGTSTIGSSEAMMLAGLAMKWNWRKRREQAGASTAAPNLVMGENVQVCWEKFARYFDVKPRLIPVERGCYVTTPEKVVDAIDENTIGVCAILGSTFTGEFEPVEQIHDAVAATNDKYGWDIPVHVDAASGGFVAPFLYPDLRWDFRLPLVRSINVSGHKYGLVYPGIGWVIWRDRTALPEELVFHVNYLGGDMPTFNLNFSRPAAGVVAQYYNLLRLGREGYTAIMRNAKQVSDFIRHRLEAMEQFDIVSDDHSLPLIAWSVKADAGYTAFELSDKLRENGWIVPAYTMPKNATDVAVLRVVVREGMSHDVAESLVSDVQRAIRSLGAKSAAPAEPAKPKRKTAKIC